MNFETMSDTRLILETLLFLAKRVEVDDALLDELEFRVANRLHK